MRLSIRPLPQNWDISRRQWYIELLISIPTSAPLTRVVNLSNTADEALKTIQNMMPRAQMDGAILDEYLRKFEQSGFDPNVELKLQPQRAREIASRFGYPLDDVLAERG